MQCKIFAHRGITSNSIRENTIGALENANRSGFKAVECDIYYWNDKLLLSHDQPLDNVISDSLEDFLKIFGDKMEYWLDFKNLTNINADMAIKNLKKITDQLKFDQNKIYFVPFITLLEDGKIIYEAIRKYFGNLAQIVTVKEKLLPEDYQNYYSQLKENNIFGLSIEYQNITPELIKIFSDIKIFAWTVNEPNDIRRLEQAGIYALTTDIIPNDKK